MIEREPIGDAAAAIVAGEAEMHVAERLHHLDHRVRHGALGVGRMRRVAGRRGGPAVAGQIRHDQAEMPRQRRRHAVPHDIGLRIAMEQKERRPLPSGAREDASGGGVDPLGGEAWKEVGKIGHDLALTLPLHRPEPDIAPAEPVGPADAIDRLVRPRLRLRDCLAER